MGHSHSHDHGLEGGWQVWARHPALRLVLVGVVAAAVATIVGLIVLWPGGDGQQTALENADEFGLTAERLAATVEEITDFPCSYSTPDNPQDCRTIELIPKEGPDAGSPVELREINISFNTPLSDVQVGDGIILAYEDSTDTYFFADLDRRTSLVALAALFAIFVVALGRFRGVLALFAMAATLLVLVGFVAPSVIDGNDPLLVAVVAASAIAFVSLYLTHGFTPTTTVALAGTLSALLLTLGISWAFFELARFTGFGSEEANFLPAIVGDINLSALLLGGAIIGALGALDDVTVTQVATVAELRHRSPNLPTTELVASGIRVGRDHIASTVNTLLLAYAGASMPLILLFAAVDRPLDIVANSEIIAVEIVRTLGGSIGLVAAVPITTALAAAVLRPGTGSDETGHIGDPAPDADPSDDVAPTARPAEPTEPVIAETPEPARWEDFAPTDDPST